MRRALATVGLGIRSRPRSLARAAAVFSVMAVLLSAVAPIATLGGSPAEQGPGLRFEPSAIKAGGFYTSVAIAPGASDTIILGGGNSGYHRSTDLGASFEARNRGLETLADSRIASLTFHPTRAGLVYAATGTRGRDGGFARSTDDGMTWEVLSSEPRFAGQDNVGIANLPEFPRSTGSLLAAHEDTVWAGTFQQGVMRSKDGGRTWQPIGLEGRFVRSLVRHPTDPGKLYVALWEGGVQTTTDALSDVVTFSPSAGAPATVEELAFVGQTLYAAAGTDGLFRLEGESWASLDAGVPSGASWSAITGIDTGEAHLLFAGCDACVADESGERATVIRSTDSGVSWHNITRAENLDFRVVGSGERWVMADAVPNYMPGAADGLVSQLVAKPTDDGAADRSVVLWAGRGGLWRSTDSGTTWAPAVNGLSEAGSLGLAVDPADPRRIFQGAGHFGLQASTDAFRTVHIDALRSVPTLAGHTHPAANRTAFDTTTTPSTVIIAAGDRERKRVGGVYLNADPFSSTEWVDLGYTRDVPESQPTSLAVGHDAEGQRIIVAAAHPRGGLVRKVGDGPWERVEGTDALTKTSGVQSDMLWIPDTSVIFFYDLAQGIYRSVDAGVSWVRIWDHASDVLGTGALAAVDPGTVYVAAADGLYRLDGADVGSVETGEVGVTRIGGEQRVADAFLDDVGVLWAVVHPDASAPTKVLMIHEPEAARPTVYEFADEMLANTMIVPETLVVTADGTVLVGGLRSGTLRGSFRPAIPVP